ncbi:hypothetical protein DEU34_0072 [Microbacterium sp. AG1240]|uniref:hypothetical protein n=1 Tax=Microbacterium sp. AG1240 TaxID=2183992 RepID=UPI000F2688E4|nr:hypothetical protein [Microbacterium sp. AG1240]RKT35569.1 hypothetical protein DEU34_0072 [Microbacterium sp. AG1240]
MRRRLSPLVLALIAITAALAIPVVFVAGAAYGIESEVWDAARSTYVYEERPGGGFAVIAALVACAALAALAIVAGMAAADRRRGPQHPLAPR